MKVHSYLYEIHVVILRRRNRRTLNGNENSMLRKIYQYISTKTQLSVRTVRKCPTKQHASFFVSDMCLKYEIRKTLRITTLDRAENGSIIKYNIEDKQQSFT